MWLNKYPDDPKPKKTLLKDKKVGEVTTKIKDVNLKDKKYKGLFAGVIEKEGCPDGVGCSEQVTDYIANDMGIDRNLLSPQHAAYRSAQFKRDGAQELFNPYPKGTKINTSGYNYTPIPKEIVQNLQYGDFVNLDHGNDAIAIAAAYGKPAYMTEDENNDASHWGVVVGKDDKGNPLIRHGWAGKKNKGQFKVEPLTPDNNYNLSIGSKDFRVATAYRPKPFTEEGVVVSKKIVDKGEDIAQRKQQTTSGTGFYLGNTEEEKLIKDLPVAAQFSGANARLNTKKRLEGYINNKQLDEELKYSLGITQAELDGYKPVAYGIAGQETNFGDVNSMMAAAKDAPGNALNMGNSKGLFQIKYASLTPEEREVIGINSPNDLLDDEKSYKASILMLKNAKKRIDSEVEKGTHPGLADKDPYFRAAYYYNSPARAVSTAKEWAEGSNPVTLNPGTWLNKLKTRERDGIFADVDLNYKDRAELKMDIGSYPYKVMQAAKDLKQYIAPDENVPVNLEEVVVRTTKGKNKKYIPVEKNGGTIPKMPDGGKLTGKKNDPLRPKGLGVQAQDNIRPIPMFDPIAIRDSESIDAVTGRTQARNNQKKASQQKADKELARRKAAIDKSNTEGGFKNSAVAEKMRLFPNSAGGWGEVFDDYINLPRVLIGESADKLGHAKTAKEYAAAIATPIVIGATGYNPIENIPNMVKNTGKFLTEQTPLKNAYKLNPYAEKLANPNNSYRVAGRDSYNDFLNTGTVRSVAPSASLEELSAMTMPEKFKAIGRPTSFPSFQKGFADTRYLPKDGGVIYETSVPTFKRGEINPVTGETIRGRHYAHRPIDMKTGKTITELPASDVKVFEGKPNWLQGYKELPKTQTTSQEILSTSSGMDAIKSGYNSQMFVKQGYVPPTTDPRLMATLSEETVQVGANNVGRGNISNVTSGAKPSTQTNTLGYKSEIDWAKWNKEIPANRALMKEYNTIEQASKANGTWMKNPDGSAFQGTPEQFVQQNSQNFKKAFPEGSENVFRGTGENISELRPNRSIFTANQELASGYAPYNKKSNFLNSESTEGGVHNFYRKNTKNSIELDGNNTSWTSVDLSNKRLTKDYFERNIKSQEDQIFKTKEYLSKMKQEPSGSWKAPDGTTYSNDLYKNTVAERELYLKDLKERYKNIDNLVSNPKELEEMRKVLGDKTTTDDIAAYIEKKNLDYVKLKNIEDSGVGDVTIVNHKPGNYLKSAIGNNGMFNMTNPNTYKALVPTVIGAGILQQKQQGGWLNNYK